MKTSQQWWDEVKNDPIKTIGWLKDQYHGEATAATKIQELFFVPGNTLTNKQASILQRIIQEENTHAEWVKQLLVNRGITAEVLDKESRYWNQVLPATTTDKQDLAAIAHHAETMRLERIAVISADPETPKDIAAVFNRILPMEMNHAKWFAELSSPECIKAALPNHKNGLNALGLVH
jgi:rubrerythrin